MSEPGSAGLYLHVPFCSAVCPYCDFAVLRDDASRHGAFVGALLREAEERAEEFTGWSFDTVYLGGGTPSALAPERLATLLEGLRARLPIAPRARLHIEANPEDLRSGTLRAWRDLDLAFLSLGVQSFDDAELRFLGRRHDGEQARRALELAVAEGPETVSCDLIFGLPGQSPENLVADVTAAAERRPGHVSGYQLTVKEGTPFARRVAAGRWSPLGDGDQGRLFDVLHDALEAAGYSAYEVSNFRREERHESRHNRKYWDRTPYLGLGPSAHSFDGRRRSWNHRDLGAWEGALAAGRGAVEDRETLGPWDLVAESLMLGFRRSRGLDVAALVAASGWDPRREAPEALARALEEGHLSWREGFLVPNRAGMAIADALARDLCPDPDDLPETGQET